MTNQDDQNAQDSAPIQSPETSQADNEGLRTIDQLIADIRASSPPPSFVEVIAEDNELEDTARLLRRGVIDSTPVGETNLIQEFVGIKSRPRITGVQTPDGKTADDDLGLFNPIFRAIPSRITFDAPKTLVPRAPTTAPIVKRFGSTNQSWGSSGFQSFPKRSRLLPITGFLFVTAAATAGFFYRTNIREAIANLPNAFRATSGAVVTTEAKPVTQDLNTPIDVTTSARNTKPVEKAAPQVAKAEPKVEAAPAAKITEAKPAPKAEKFDWSVPASKENDAVGGKIEAAKKEALKILELYPNNKDVETVVKSIFNRLGGSKVNAVDFHYVGFEKDGKTFVRLMTSKKYQLNKFIEEGLFNTSKAYKEVSIRALIALTETEVGEGKIQEVQIKRILRSSKEELSAELTARTEKYIDLNKSSFDAILNELKPILSKGNPIKEYDNLPHTYETKNINDLKRSEHVRIASAIAGGIPALAFTDYAGKEDEVEKIIAAINKHLPAANDYFYNFRANHTASLFPKGCVDDAQKEFAALEAISPSKAPSTIAKALAPNDKNGEQEQIERAQDDLTQPTIDPKFLRHINEKIESVESIHGLGEKLDNLSAILERGPLSLGQLVELTKQNNGKLELV